MVRRYDFWRLDVWLLGLTIFQLRSDSFLFEKSDGSYHGLVFGRTGPQAVHVLIALPRVAYCGCSGLKTMDVLRRQGNRHMHSFERSTSG